MNLEKEKRAIEILRSFHTPDDPYYLCYSGGKDSDTIKILAQLAGVNFEAHHNLTTVDAPETVYYIRSQPDVEVHHPHTSMWRLIEKKLMPPTRLMRYCCSVLKEGGGAGRKKITGVRWSESNRRRENADVVRIVGKPATTKKIAEETGVEHRQSAQSGIVLSGDNDASRKTVELCYKTTSTTINPIIDWDDDDVWEFLHHYGCRSNPLYECGYKRIGCVGCPMGGGKSMKREFERYPKYKENYIKAFDRMLLRRKERGYDDSKGGWTDGEHVMRWWVGDDPRQITIDDMLNDMDGEDYES